MKENQIRELVNELRDIAIEYHGTQQLRERIARTVRAAIIQAGNSPVTHDGWISCSERMPAQDDWILIYSKHGEYMAGQVQGEYVELSDGTLSWLGNALFWMQLPEPPL
ncbi:DUF551 domain-containing protein [Salmonella enterica subsp. enterica serovar Indiana]|nr:DUF551 domain-containing protein [Salmonella enterica]EBG8151885.1 DUF551 domain-containing protein [Salmonella enterica subsp. enterica serovar Indiana]EBS2184287.1 DUF551 domain-containing protein [Salmonella enterica subsp. enterica serovar Chester]EBV5338455.1 DUF551 domain-containing protein [Salmonella enterica subsp. enterica serovar Ituri]EBW7850452.1 DUF551 domain-containing protein [Salmonella enterica subsp. enterica serovar Limete]ECB1241626.1 DUF551 domain-containing protein [S